MKKISISMSSKKIDIVQLQKLLKTSGFSGVAVSGGFTNKTLVYRGNNKVATISESGRVTLVNKNDKATKDALTDIVKKLKDN